MSLPEPPSTPPPDTAPVLGLADVLTRLRSEEGTEPAALSFFTGADGSLARQLEQALGVPRLSLTTLSEQGEVPGSSAGQSVLLLEDEVSEQIIGAVCRRCPEGVLAIVRRPAEQAGPTVADAQRWLAFGFRMAGAMSLDEPESARDIFDLYEYHLSDYKPSPRWLNARFWAHPERFGVDDGSDENPDDDDDDDDEEE